MLGSCFSAATAAMNSLSQRRLSRWALAVVALGGWVGLAAQSALSKADADRFLEKVTSIEHFKQRMKGGSQRTPLSEAEVNAYFAYQGREQIPSGVVEPQVWILGGGRLSGRAVVDLDAVREKHKSTGWFDPMNYLSGRLPVTASGTLRTRDGMAWLDLDSIRISGIPVPKRLLQELVSYYSRTPQTPEGINLDEPFPLPARIREIDVGRPREAVVVQ
jgi:hypothetical protein